MLPVKVTYRVDPSPSRALRVVLFLSVARYGRVQRIILNDRDDLVPQFAGIPIIRKRGARMAFFSRAALRSAMSSRHLGDGLISVIELSTVLSSGSYTFSCCLRPLLIPEWIPSLIPNF